MHSRWLTLIALLLLITIKEPAMAENQMVSEDMRSEIAALVAAESGHLEQGRRRSVCRSSAARYLVHQHFWYVLGRQSSICRPT